MEQSGFILIADITGYTVYLTRSELEHAQGTLTDLLELLIDHTRPPLAISRLEGDAVISYALGDGFVSGQSFLESIEETYVAFRRAIELMILNNTCQCNACANVSSLDLKFFLHHGTFALQAIGEHDELIGTDVNLIHRLLKNTVTGETGIRAYLLLTDAAEKALEVDEATGEMIPHREFVADLGDVAMWVKDMHPVYEARRQGDREIYPPEALLGEIEVDISLPPELVWDYLNQSEFRNLLIGSDRQEVTDRKAGRIAPGSTYQCYHGKMIVTQLVVHWQPFERVVVQQLLPLPGPPTRNLLDYELVPTEAGTRLVARITKPTGPLLQRVTARTMVQIRKKKAQQDLHEFRDQIEADHAARESAQLGIVPFTLDAIRSAARQSLQSSERPGS